MTPVPLIRAFFDEATNTVSYLIADPVTRDAAVVDPVLDYDHATGEVNARSVEAILASAGDAAGGSSGRWKPTPMPTIFPVRP